MNESNTAPRTEADAVAAIAARVMPEFRSIASTPLAIHRDGKIESLERYLPEPLRERARAVFNEPQSFINYVMAHDDEGTHLFGDVTEAGGSFTAILDYHLPTAGDTSRQGAQWGEHTARLNLQVTPEWQRWLGSNAKPFEQAQFAEFLEDNVRDVVKPSGAELLEVALTLQAAKKVAFRSGMRLSNGEHQLTYVEEIAGQAGATGQLQVPERFTIAVAPFEGTEPVEIEVRLRYRLMEGRVVFVYQLLRPDVKIREVWQGIRERITEVTNRGVYRGTAEVLAPKP
ncbi:MAG TPA: DUF2303 family protein [Opitutaceae bacterium]|nr:DUF2303 family protein [Opitutaceae bacterium]HLP26733.1 DUF2303 family protein [Acidobacteriota bacterium]